VLAELVPALRAAANARGHLSPAEIEEFGKRDAFSGRVCREPARGRAAGIAPDGALLIETPMGVKPVREGSLVLDDAEERI
jgi:hypothetical protein